MQRTRKAAEKLPWDDVRLFLALFRSQTVGEAAMAPGIDASTVSRRLAAMEESLSATLFDRGRDGIAATKAAEDLMPVAEVIVAPLVPGLLASHPALRIEIDPGETVLDLTRREADLAVRTVRPVRGDLVVTRVATVRWVLVAGARGGADARDAPLLDRRAVGRLGRALLEHRAGALAGDPRTRCRVRGALRKPDAAAGARAEGRRRDAAGEWPSDELFLVTYRALRQVPRVRVVWDLLNRYAINGTNSAGTSCWASTAVYCSIGIGRYRSVRRVAWAISSIASAKVSKRGPVSS